MNNHPCDTKDCDSRVYLRGALCYRCGDRDRSRLNDHIDEERARLQKMGIDKVCVYVGLNYDTNRAYYVYKCSLCQEGVVVDDGRPLQHTSDECLVTAFRRITELEYKLRIHNL